VPQAVKTVAVEHGLPVLQPERLKDDAFLATLRDLEPDVAVVAAYGRLLPHVTRSSGVAGVTRDVASRLRERTNRQRRRRSASMRSPRERTVLTGTTTDVTPIVAVDGRYRRWPGPVARALLDRLLERWTCTPALATIAAAPATLLTLLLVLPRAGDSLTAPAALGDIRSPAA
jgi:hypothetical protein